LFGKWIFQNWDSIALAQDTNKWRALVIVVMNHWIP